MMNEEEVLGQTYYNPPEVEGPLQSLGAGRVIKPEHAEASDAELENLGYSFHMGRSDFEAILPVEEEPVPVESLAKSKKAAKADDAPSA